MSDKTLIELSTPEVKLLRRLRGLHAGSHLIIINTTGEGVASLTMLNSGKVERLTEGRPAPPAPQVHIQPG